jgi:hypothetical protein
VSSALAAVAKITVSAPLAALSAVFEAKTAIMTRTPPQDG